MRTTYNLPMEMVLPTGEILKPVIGGMLDNKPFVLPSILQVSWLAHREIIINEARRRKLKYRVIGVLSRNLRGKFDLHGQLYRPNVWVLVQVP